MQLIEHLKWRYATKKFDTSKIISSSDIEILKEAMQLSVSSYGLQLYKIIIIEDATIREQLKEASWNQEQITDASHLIVFCNYTNVTNVHVDMYLNLTAKIQGVEVNNLEGYGTFMKGKIGAMSEAESKLWTQKQTYLALGNLLNACAELKIDACPMEGFESEEYNAILKLSEKGLHASVIATIGYRSEDDYAQHQPKVRKSKQELFLHM